MEWLIIVIMIIIFWATFAAKKKLKTKIINTEKVIDKKMETANDLKIMVSVTGEDDVKRDTGKISQYQEDGFILSDKSTFPLTLLNCIRELAIKIKATLDATDTFGSYKQAREIGSFLLENEVKCKEVEDYLNEYKPKYQNTIDRLINESSEWNNASEKDRNDLLYEFKQQAYNELEVRPFLDISILFENAKFDFTVAQMLSKKYGYENLRFYLRLSDNLDQVRVIKADHRDRNRYENLVMTGLAIRGLDIELVLILDSMKLKDINELIDTPANNFKRKAEAIDYLKGKIDTTVKLGKIISFRELFKLNPLPGTFDNMKAIINAFEYYKVISELITHTYSFGTMEYQRWKEESRDRNYIIGWKIFTAGDESACDYCKKMAAKKYDKRAYPKTPFHIGCRCSPEPILQY